MINYSKSIIYKICCNDPTVKDEYIGSTTNFRNRKWQHKYSCNKLNNEKYNRRLYVFIRETGGWLNWSMIEIEKYDATDKRHLETRERYWIEELKSSLNNYIPTRTSKEIWTTTPFQPPNYNLHRRLSNSPHATSAGKGRLGRSHLPPLYLNPRTRRR